MRWTTGRLEKWVRQAGIRYLPAREKVSFSLLCCLISWPDIDTYSFSAYKNLVPGSPADKEHISKYLTSFDNFFHWMGFPRARDSPSFMLEVRCPRHDLKVSLPV